MKTDVMILGAQKSATSSLFEMLRQTGHVVGSSPKEPHFFSQTEDWRRNLHRYEQIYSPRSGALYCEASTTYTFYPHRKLDIWDDIFEYNPQMKFIYIVRDPMDRILSHYKHSFRRGYTRGSLDDFVVRNPLPLSISRYYMQIIPYIRKFGRDRVLLLQFEDVVSGREETMEQIVAFLGLEDCRLSPVHANESSQLLRRGRLVRLSGRVHPALARIVAERTTPEVPRSIAPSPALRRAVLNVLETDIAALEQLMDANLSPWRKGT